MKTIQVNAYEYNELNDEAKFKVKLWLNEIPLDYDTGEIDENGKPIIKDEYPGDWSDEEINEHCELNNYLFDKWGNCVHHLDINRNKKEAA
jgi:hypothetical protein